MVTPSNKEGGGGGYGGTSSPQPEKLIPLGPSESPQIILIPTNFREVMANITQEKVSVLIKTIYDELEKGNLTLQGWTAFLQQAGFNRPTTLGDLSTRVGQLSRLVEHDFVPAQRTELKDC